MKKIKVILDFDGTMVAHRYPTIGKTNPHSISVIKKLHRSGHSIILNTYRSNISVLSLRESIEWLEIHIPELGQIQYLDGKKDPLPYNSNDIKTNQLVFIDDIAENIPLIPCHDKTSNMVDWVTLDKDFQQLGLYDLDKIYDLSDFYDLEKEIKQKGYSVKLTETVDFNGVYLSYDVRDNDNKIIASQTTLNNESQFVNKFIIDTINL